jgi:poly(beta-D-mannuronate) C5 epimerase
MGERRTGAPTHALTTGELGAERVRRGRGAVAGVVAACVVAGGASVYRAVDAARQEPRGPVVASETPPTTRYPLPDRSLVVAPDGRDGDPGTLARPLRTVAAAVDHAPPGTTIVLRSGTYREKLGRLHKRLTVQPYPGERVWFKGSVMVGGWRRDGRGWRHDHWSPDLCRTCFLPSIIDPAAALAGQPDMVFVDGVSLPQVATQRELRPGTFRVDTRAHVLWLGSDPTGHSVEATAFDRLVQLDPGAEGSVLQGLGVAQYGSNQDYGRRGAMVVVNADDVVIRDSVFVSSASTGLAVYSADVVVQHSVFSHNGLAGLVGNHADRLRLVGNTAAGNNVERFAITGDAVGAAGVKLAHTRNAYVADNVFRGNYGSGWWCDLGCTDAVVVRNVAEGNAVNGLHYEVSSRALIASNVLRGNRKRGLKISGSDRVRVWSNTFIGNAVALGIYGDPRDVSFDPYSAALGQPWRPVGLQVVNNVFASGDGSDQPYLETADQQPHRTTADQMLARADGNVYVRGRNGLPTTFVSWWRGPAKVSDYRSVSDLAAGTGRELHGSEAVGAPDELFRGLARGDYTLLPGAPGARAGLPLPRDVAVATGATAADRPDAGVVTAPRR